MALCFYYGCDRILDGKSLLYALMKVKRFLLLVLGLINFQMINAQCVMCRTQVVNNVSHGDVDLAGGLNSGIIYLFSAPYLLILLVFVLWYKFFYLHGKKNKIVSHF
jgi:hypothetical protein